MWSQNKNSPTYIEIFFKIYTGKKWETEVQFQTAWCRLVYGYYIHLDKWRIHVSFYNHGFILTQNNCLGIITNDGRKVRNRFKVTIIVGALFLNILRFFITLSGVILTVVLFLQTNMKLSFRTRILLCNIKRQIKSQFLLGYLLTEEQFLYQVF